MKKRERVDFARQIIETSNEKFKELFTHLVRTNRNDLTVEISKQLKLKVEDKKTSMNEKEPYIAKCEIITEVIESFVNVWEQKIVDAADYVDAIQNEYTEI